MASGYSPDSYKYSDPISSHLRVSSFSGFPGPCQLKLSQFSIEEICPWQPIESHDASLPASFLFNPIGHLYAFILIFFLKDSKFRSASERMASIFLLFANEFSRRDSICARLCFAAFVVNAFWTASGMDTNVVTPSQTARTLPAPTTNQTLFSKERIRSSMLFVACVMRSPP